MKGVVITWRERNDSTTPVEIAPEYPGIFIPCEKMIMYVVGRFHDRLLADRFTEEERHRITMVGREIDVPFCFVAAGLAYLEAGERLREAKIEFAGLVGCS